jgi:hypothetical protein
MATNNIINNQSVNANLAIIDNQVAATARTLDLVKLRGAGALVSGDDLGGVFFKGYDGANYQIGASIIAQSSGTIAGGKVPALIKLSTKSDTVASIQARLTINSEGNVTIATPTSGTSLTCTAGDVRARTIFATGDEGTGIVSQTAFTNVTNVAANSTGVFTIKSKSTNAADSIGFIKIWVETTAYWIPYFANPAP